MQQKKSIKQLLSCPTTDLRQLITHQQIILIIKNQDPILKTIFNSNNTYLMLSYLNQQHGVYGQFKQLAYKLPYAAMEIMCCQSHHITEVIFQSERETTQYHFQTEKNGSSPETSNKQPPTHLLQFLLSFLHYRQHYYLAGLFSKVVSLLTKRVFAPSHKYNQILCDKVFGLQFPSPQTSHPLSKPYLFLTLNHIYSQSINQLIIRWLTLKSLKSQYKKIKQQFITYLLELINTQQSSSPKYDIKNFTNQTLQSIINLISLMLKSSLFQSSQKSQPPQQKNLNLMLNKNSQKQLYQLLCQQKFLFLIFQPVPNPNLSKLHLIKKILQHLKIQNQKLQKIQQYRDIHLNSIISEQMLIQCMEWVHQNLLNFANSIEYQHINGNDKDNEQTDYTFAVCQTGLPITTPQGIGSKTIKPQCLQKLDKKYILAYLQLHYQFHLHPSKLRQPLLFIYQQKSRQQVQIILKFLRLKNNLIHNILTKIIITTLKKYQCTNFRTILLHHGIANVIDEEGIRQHVIQWAKIILQSKNQRGRIYQNAQQQTKWDHMTQVISAAQQILIGRYRYQPSNLQLFYSTDKAKQFYAQFLHLPILIQYQQKITSSRKAQSQKSLQQQHNLILNQQVLKKKMSSPPVFGNNSTSNNNNQQQSTLNSDQQNPLNQITPISQSNLQQDKPPIIQLLTSPILTIYPQSQQQQDILIQNVQQRYLFYELDDVLKQLE